MKAASSREGLGATCAYLMTTWRSASLFIEEISNGFVRTTPVFLNKTIDENCLVRRGRFVDIAFFENPLDPLVRLDLPEGSSADVAELSPSTSWSLEFGRLLQYRSEILIARLAKLLSPYVRAWSTVCGSRELRRIFRVYWRTFSGISSSKISSSPPATMGSSISFGYF